MAALCTHRATVRSSEIWSTFSIFQTLRGSLTAVSTPIFASKASFFSVFRALHFLLCTSPEFCDFSIPLHRFFPKDENLGVLKSIVCMRVWVGGRCGSGCGGGMGREAGGWVGGGDLGGARPAAMEPQARM